MNIERRIQQLEQDADARFDSAFHPYLNLVIEEGVWMAEHAPPAFEVWREALAAGRMYELTEDEQATLSAVQWPDSLRAKAERKTRTLKHLRVTAPIPAYIAASTMERRAEPVIGRGHSVRQSE